MSIYTFIKKFLGYFWVDFVTDNSFCEGILNLHSFIFHNSNERLRKDTSRLVADDTDLYDCSFPFTLYLLKETATDPETGEEHHTKEAFGLDKVLLEGAPLYEDDSNAGFTVKSLYTSPDPWFITDHVVDYTKTLFEGADFSRCDDQFIFYVDPSKLGFTEVHMLDKDGKPRTYYKAFGWSKPKRAGTDMVEAFEGAKLGEYSDIVWDIHQKGATVGNVKELLCNLTDTVISKQDGTVRDIWSEQGFTCVRVDDLVYCSKTQGADCCVSMGQHIKKGQVLFGDMLMVHGDEVLSEPSYISNDDSSVVDIYTWDNVKYVLTSSDEVYSAPASWVCNCSVGQVLRQGDEVFTPGQLPSYGIAIPADKLAGLLVRTSAGDFIAPNKDMKALQTSVTVSNGQQVSINVLPLMGERISAYVAQCKEAHLNRVTPEINIPTYVNPMAFVLNKIRRAYELLVCISGLRSKAMSSAIECIQRNMIASCILEVYVNVQNEPCILDTWERMSSTDVTTSVGDYAGTEGTQSLNLNSIF